MTLEKIFKFLQVLVDNKFTGRIILDFHEGNISKKVKKETVDTLDWIKF